MKRGLLIVVLTLSLAAVGCGGGGSNANLFELLRNCGVEGVLNLLATVERLGDVLEEIENQPVIAGANGSDVTVTETSENTYEFTLLLDLDGDLVNETTITGTWAFDRDITDGGPSGAVSTLTFSQTASSEAPDVSATGLQVTFLSNNQISVVGSVLLLNFSSSNCEVNLTMPASDPLVIDFSDEEEARIAVNVANFLAITGSVTADIDSGSNNLLTTLILSALSNDVTFTGNELNGEMLNDVQEEAFLSEEEFAALQQCTFASFFVFTLGTVLEDVLDGESGSALLQGEAFDYTLTPVVGGAPFEFDLVATDTDIGIDATITARVTFSASPSTPSFDGTADLASWSVIVNPSSPAQLAGIPIFFTDLTASSTSPMRVTFDDGDAESVYGGGRFDVGNGLCTGTIDIPATNPVFIFGGAGPQPGRATISLTSSGIPVLTGGLPESLRFDATFVFPDSEFLDDILVTGAVIDGIAVPGNLLTELFNFLF